MNQVAQGAPISESYIGHMDLCLACRALIGLPFGRAVWPLD